jgi:hypothetical protein
MRITEQIMQEVQQIADLHYGGHYTIFRFTSNWKAVWGTPIDVRTNCHHAAAYNTFEDALIGLIYQHDRALAEHFSKKIHHLDIDDVIL